MDLLPPELLPHLLSFLPTHHLLHTIRMVCKMWTKQVDDLHHHLTGPLFQFRALILPCTLNHLLLDMKRHPELDLALGKELANCWDGEQLDLIQQLVNTKNTHMTPQSMPNNWKSLKYKCAFLFEFQDAKEGLVNQIIRAFFPLFYNEKCGTKCFKEVTSCLLKDTNKDATNTNTMDVLMESFVALCCQLDCPDEVVVLKVMERVLSLDVKHDWSAVFPSMKDTLCFLNNGLESDDMESLFEMECEMAIDLFKCWSGMGLKRETLMWDQTFHIEERIPIVERVRNFMFYLAGRLPNNETLRTKIVMALKTMENDHNSEVIFKMLQAGANHSNRFIAADRAGCPNLLLCVDFQTLAHNLIIFMEFVHANLLENVTLQESKKVLRWMGLQDQLINYLTYCLVSQTDSTLRINCYEVLEQTLMYLVQLGDYSSSFLINMCLESVPVLILEDTMQKQHDQAYTTLLKECLEATSSRNDFKQLMEHMKKRKSAAPSHPLLGNL